MLVKFAAQQWLSTVLNVRPPIWASGKSPEKSLLAKVSIKVGAKPFRYTSSRCKHAHVYIRKVW